MTLSSWYGSRCVGAISDFRKGLRALPGLIHASEPPRTLAEQIRKHNLWTLYTHFGFIFATACRPQVKPQINWLTIDRSFAIYVIDDKPSKFSEERVLPLGHTVRHLLHETVYEANPAIISALEHSGSFDLEAYTRIGNPILFFVDPLSHEPSLTSPKHVQGLLLEHQDLASLHIYPSNVNRHVLRSLLTNRFHAQIAPDVIDAWFGHKHAGFEPTAADAATNGSMMFDHIRKIQEDCLRCIGFRALCWRLP